MKWIKESESNYVNLDLCNRVYIQDMGQDYDERFKVFAQTGIEIIRIKSYRTLLGAQKLLESWFEKDSE